MNEMMIQDAGQALARRLENPLDENMASEIRRS
jgi:hypothetical protein